MSVEQYFPFWPKLTDAQRDLLQSAVSSARFEAGNILHAGSSDCAGLFIVVKGRLRAYTLSGEGKELTLYRLLERDICLFSASCIMRSIQFDVMISAEEPTDVLRIPPDVYKTLMEQSAAVAGYTNELMAARFSEVMWLMDQLLNRKLDSRLAAFLLEERGLSGADILPLTHERVAAHLGSAREVVTRLLRYFQSEGLVQLERGSIALTNIDGLYRTAGDSLR
ncbi:Crp/Fnr family transcriptional regulator [Agathobaculum sp. NSJ-28]|uniref:Crp/Fnr family transcriptional regulator n=2 Tax=Agathobaculum TaxID=2048137 RepID=A0A923LS98_9FIRM|nr:MULTISPECIES: Crp/Fnr family transcriptional regulator [Butyricicoccaceae]MBC5724313.1 Crp/Fnr family transcriptional regulator [Agathobaculum faecis]MCU6788045.1 Crp/Fnr family transcriptional regulator [Agathobaculum ammoniilyticum]WOC75393.1 Crp/Fnr family transcriptional regulator [Intestinibacillus sp. NTUH-41-i26]SCI57704.1 Fumarate and nitrate reduction regulatory protein [uncultured Butyricicoccus sp.]